MKIGKENSKINEKADMMDEWMHWIYDELKFITDTSGKATESLLLNDLWSMWTTYWFRQIYRTYLQTYLKLCQTNI